MELSNEVRKAIIEQKLEQWKQNQFSLELDAKVAKVLDDEKMLERVKTQLKNAIGALQILQNELQELENAVQSK